MVRWLIGNAPRQNVGGIAGSSPVLTTNGSKMRRLISVERRDAKVHTKDR